MMDDAALIIKMLSDIQIEVRAINQSLHASELRMAEMHRNISDLAASDLKQETRIKTLEGRVDDLEPVRNIVNNITKFGSIGIALALLAWAAPWIRQFLKI
jgi:septation ring formation regulator EzrA